jgi:hypothetical protein
MRLDTTRKAVMIDRMMADLLRPGSVHLQRLRDEVRRHPEKAGVLCPLIALAEAAQAEKKQEERCGKSEA